MKTRRLLYVGLAVSMLCILLGTGQNAAGAAQADSGSGASIRSLPFRVVVPEIVPSADPSAGLVWLLKALLAIIGLGAGDLALCLLAIGAGRPGGRRSG